ncbi:MAG: hypothetical protein M9894_38195 [Planctomycetes bacterium]|nr:hypothetical protein [Planctomycetota bacterium]
MLETLWRRLAGGPDSEPDLVDIRTLPDASPLVLRRLAREHRLLVTPAAAPHAFHDAPPLRRLSPALRVSVANGYALDVHQRCPPYHAQRGDGRERLFCSFAPACGAPVVVEVEFTPDGVVGPPGTRFQPEAALDLDRLLREAGFWDLPTLSGPDALQGELWHLSVVLGGRHHLLRRCRPKGPDLMLLRGVLLALGVDPSQATRGQDPARRTGCAWVPCGDAPLPGDPSRLCAGHRARVDAQGANMTRRRR